MRILALDIGRVRTGCAISDPQGRVATPLCVLPTQDLIQGAASFRRLLEDWEPELLLCGLPKSLAGSQGSQAEYTKEVAAQIAKRTQLDLEFCDERLSSQEAKRLMREKGMTEKEMRGHIDMIAASIFLQAWLDKEGR